MMTNIRQISNIQKEGSEFTLVSVKITAENVEDEKMASSSMQVGQVFSNVTDLFAAIRQYTVDLVNSGLL